MLSNLCQCYLQGQTCYDAGTYSNEGYFLPSRFENIFAKHAKERGGDSLSLGDILHLPKGQRCVADPHGWAAMFLEFGTTWLLAQQDGRIQREDLRRLYDASLFFGNRRENENTRKRE